METATTLAGDGDGKNSPLDGDVREISRPISDLEMLTLGENCFTEQEVAKKIDSVPINRESSEGREIVTGSEGTEAMAQLCVRLDVARVLVKVNLHQELVEKISFQDKEGNLREIEVAYPWLPRRCSVFRRWGHKGQDCLSKDVRILRKKSVHGGSSKFATVSQDEDIVGRKEGNVIEDLLHNPEAITPQAAQKALLVSNVALSGS
ncbi:hypothetical protein DY000_02022646 [Brassica cretica]|uniref:DUF4283 domain-containing protein n=1 Tax=Brassica cretica TaxID=69181 RepID=A0ABQ7E595_BRACR|nr:hypothetical protein DY000_02022646 [Brassica cretica]